MCTCLAPGFTEDKKFEIKSQTYGLITLVVVVGYYVKRFFTSLMEYAASKADNHHDADGAGDRAQNDDVVRNINDNGDADGADDEVESLSPKSKLLSKSSSSLRERRLSTSAN
jgi:hypothetical protein